MQQLRLLRVLWELAEELVDSRNFPHGSAENVDWLEEKSWGRLV